MQDVNSAFFDFLIKAESVEPFVYPDSNNLPTIGIGHLLTLSELTSGKIYIAGEPVQYANGLSREHIDRLCRQDAMEAIKAVNSYVTVKLTQNQFNALVSLAFNIGISAFKNSTLVRRLNLGAYSAVPLEMRRWIRSGGMVVQGLINRREAEIKLWNSIEEYS